MNVLLHDVAEVFTLDYRSAGQISLLIILLRPSPDVHALLRRLPHGVSLLYAEGLHKPAQYYISLWLQCSGAKEWRPDIENKNATVGSRREKGEANIGERKAAGKGSLARCRRDSGLSVCKKNSLLHVGERAVAAQLVRACEGKGSTTYFTEGLRHGRRACM